MEDTKDQEWLVKGWPDIAFASWEISRTLYGVPEWFSPSTKKEEQLIREILHKVFTQMQDGGRERLLEERLATMQESTRRLEERLATTP